MSQQQIELRVASEADAESIRRIYRPYIEENSVSFETVLPPVHEFELRIRETLATFPWLVALCNNEVVGYAYACSHRSREAYKWSCEASVYIDPKYQRKQVARKLYGSLFKTLEQQGIVNVYAGITLPNSASVGFHESMGFRLIGVYEDIGFKFGKWWSVGWWQLRFPVDCPKTNIIKFRDISSPLLD